MAGRVRRVLALLFAVAVAGTILTPLSYPATVAHAAWDDEASQLRVVQDALLFLMAFLGVAPDETQPPPEDLLAGALRAGLIDADMQASLRADIA